MENELLTIEDYEKTLTWNYHIISDFAEFKEIYKEAKLTKAEWQELWKSVGLKRFNLYRMEEKYGTNSNHIS
ncbi:MAG: hypothetical protein IKK93_11760 [Campylobacter sp.]|nr:hypothetical protein [Campylobacter sp.]